MSHEIIINDADIELDYADVYENIADAVRDDARDAVREYAWDECQGEVEEMIDSLTRSNEDVESQIQELLGNYATMKEDGRDVCSIGRAFERAVRNVGGTVDDSLDVQKRLADLEHKMNTVLAALFDLGERASAVDNRAV